MKNGHKILFVLFLAYVMWFVNSLIEKLPSVWSSNYKTETSKSFNYRGDLPSDFKVVINFENEDYQHIHTQNNGGYLIEVYVKSKSYMSVIGQLKLYRTTYICTLSSGNGILNGHLEVFEKYRVFGKKSSSEIKKEMREKAINEIIKSLEI